MEEFKVKNFLFSSSATVYGAPQYLPLNEQHPCVGDAITNPYGKSKYICEHILKDTSIAHSVKFSDDQRIHFRQGSIRLGLEYHYSKIF